MASRIEHDSVFFCIACGTRRLLEHLSACGRCGSVAFCDAACQTRYWPIHKLHCKKLAVLLEAYVRKSVATHDSSELPKQDIQAIVGDAVPLMSILTRWGGLCKMAQNEDLLHESCAGTEKRFAEAALRPSKSLVVSPGTQRVVSAFRGPATSGYDVTPFLRKIVFVFLCPADSPPRGHSSCVWPRGYPCSRHSTLFSRRGDKLGHFLRGLRSHQKSVPG
jgi:hypothetical protein